jgi:hypothetical protein
MKMPNKAFAEMIPVSTKYRSTGENAWAYFVPHPFDVLIDSGAPVKVFVALDVYDVGR